MLNQPRSMLFVSGEKTERFSKALATQADLVCIDLEDAVLPENKADARKAVLAFAATHVAKPNQPKLAIRINSLRTTEGLKDVQALIDANITLDFLLLPKFEFEQDVSLVHAWLSKAFNALAVLIETPLGIQNAPAIAMKAREPGNKLAALMLGGADLAVELGCSFNWDGLLHARGTLVNAAKLAGLQVWDVPHLDVNNLQGLHQETRAIQQLGFTCKTAIHPLQISTINNAFAPAAIDIEWAEALIAANQQRVLAGTAAGAFLYQGKLVDAPVLAKAMRITEIAKLNQA